MQQSVFYQALRFIIVEVLWSAVYYPVWWYTTGLKIAVKKFGENIAYSSYSLGLGIQFRNMFRPMYADYSIAGRIISFFMRLVMLIYRLIEMLFYFIFYAIFLLFWVVMPIVIFICLLNQIYIINLLTLLK